MNFDLGDFILWGWVVAHWAVAVRRTPVWFRRFYDLDRKQFHSIHSKEQSRRSAAWHVMGLVWIWPWYEGLRWVRDTIVRRMTAEEREQERLEAARKVIADYEAEQFRKLDT